MSHSSRESIDDRDTPIHVVSLQSPLHLISPQTPTTINVVKKTKNTTTPKFKSFQSDATTRNHIDSFDKLFAMDNQSKDVIRASLYRDALDQRRWCELINRFRFCDNFDFIVKSLSMLYIIENPDGRIVYSTAEGKPFSQEMKLQILQLFQSLLLGLKESSEIQYRETTGEIERLKYQVPPSPTIQKLIRLKVQLKIFQKLLENSGITVEFQKSEYLSIIHNTHLMSNSLKEIKSSLLSQFNSQLVFDGVEFKRKTTAASSAVFRLNHPASQFTVVHMLTFFFAAVQCDPSQDRRFYLYLSAAKDKPSVDAKPAGLVEDSYFLIGWSTSYVPPTRVKQLPGVSLHVVSYLPFCRTCRSTLHASCSLLNSIPKKRKK